MTPVLPDASVTHYRTQQRLTAATTLGARRLWARLGQDDFDATWRAVGPALLALMTAAQRTAAQDAARYVPAVVEELDLPRDMAGRVSAEPLIGVASDGRPLDSLLFSPVTAVREALGEGLELAQALLLGRGRMDRIVQTQIADAARITASVSIVTHYKVDGWVRMLNLPSCSRCVVLAGKFYAWNEGFERHPGCDCRHIPASENVAGDLRTDPRAAIESGQVTGLSQADTRAIVSDGADVGQVINARRGMYTAAAYGRQLAATQEGVTARAVAGRRLAEQGGRYTRTPRLRPEEIYRLAGDDRPEALRLLHRFGYLL